MSITDYRNFDLLITRAGERYRAFVVDAPAGEDSVLFDLPFTTNALPLLGGSDLMRGVSRHIGAAEDGPAASLIDVGSRLFAAIFRDEVQSLLVASLSTVAQEGAGLRLRLRFEKDAADLAILPWETLYDPTLAHFVGLSEQTPMADARGRPHLVQDEQVAALLRNHPALRLAYLNACEGALASGQSVFTGVAQTLVRAGLPAAVAMQAEISDPGAIELARTFYTALAAGRPVDAALTQARVSLSAAGSQEWAIPVLFSRSPDNRLFDIRQVLPTPDCPYPGMTPFSEAQQRLFFGRERETAEAVERLRQHPFLAVVGSSGSGKSSLIQAGILPALRASRRFGNGDWSVQIMRPGQQPLSTLAATLPPARGESEATQPSRTLLVIDQFEELFTLAKAGEVQPFVDALQALMDRPNLYLLLAVRADFYSELMACALWPSIKIADRVRIYRAIIRRQGDQRPVQLRFRTER